MYLHLVLIYLSYAIDTGKTETTTYTCNPNSACGCSKQNAILSKIVGGEQAVSNSWGWAVSLRISGSHVCGASILTDSYVITAAHCALAITSLQSASIYVGINTLSQTDQVRTIAQIFIHINYNSNTYENDIALLRLSSPLDMSDTALSIICIPDVTTTLAQEYPLPGTSLVAIGWGVLSSGSRTVSSTLQQVTLTVIKNTDSSCKGVISDTSEQFCASGTGKDTCQGDSGGPLMMFVQSSQQWQLVGITSYGVGCASPNFAGVYTRVANYQDWIDCVLSQNNTLCTASIIKLGTSGTDNLMNINYVLLIITIAGLYMIKK